MLLFAPFATQKDTIFVESGPLGSHYSGANSHTILKFTRKKTNGRNLLLFKQKRHFTFLFIYAMVKIKC
jgi:hypothetical protein